MSVELDESYRQQGFSIVGRRFVTIEGKKGIILEYLSAGYLVVSMKGDGRFVHHIAKARDWIIDNG